MTTGDGLWVGDGEEKVTVASRMGSIFILLFEDCRRHCFRRWKPLTATVVGLSWGWGSISRFLMLKSKGKHLRMGSHDYNLHPLLLHFLHFKSQIQVGILFISDLKTWFLLALGFWGMP